MNLFLQGEKKIGKTTELHHALTVYERQIAGLFVQRLYTGDRPLGFRACPVSGVLPSLVCEWRPALDHVFLYCGNWNMPALEEAMITALRQCRMPSCKLVLLDEIGGMELASTTFMEALDEILSLGKPCIGVLKSRENLLGSAWSRRLTDDCLTRHEQLAVALTTNGRLLTMHDGNREEVRREIDVFLKTVMQD